jgi:hypothetical protein
VWRRARKYASFSMRVAANGIASIRQSSVTRMRSARCHACAAAVFIVIASSATMAVRWRLLNASSVALASWPSTLEAD